MKFVGIDLGTCKTMAVAADGEIVLEATGSQQRPSIIAMMKQGPRLIGEEAQPQYSRGAIKMLPYLLGKTGHRLLSSDPFTFLPCPIEASESLACISFENHDGKMVSFSTTAAMGMFLGQLIARIEELHGKDVSLGFAVPRGCSKSLTRAYKEACSISGLDDSSRIKFFPTDEALAASYSKKLQVLKPPKATEYSMILEIGMMNSNGKL